MRTHARYEILNPPRIAKNGCIIIHEDCDYDAAGKRTVTRFAYICSRDVRMIAERTLAGVPYFLASLVTMVDKEHIAFIHANAERLLSMEYEKGDWNYAKA